MDSDPVVIEISSEEEDFSLEGLSGTSLDWHPKLMEHVGEVKKEADSSGSDDDCLVLDTKTESPIMIIEEEEGMEDGSDELLAIGEKGQLACRDYPHPRHSCATFPFSTTLHRRHCDLCYCYVCDSPAPCSYWPEHCHSTDKEQRWKIERKYFKVMRQWNSETVPAADPPREQTSDPTAPDMSPINCPNSPRNQDPIISPTPTTAPSPPQDCAPQPKSMMVERYKRCPFAFSFRRRRPVLNLPEDDFLEQEPEKPWSKPELLIPEMPLIEYQDGGALATQSIQCHPELESLASSKKQPMTRSYESKDKSRLNSSTCEGSSVDSQTATSPPCSPSLSTSRQLTSEDDLSDDW